MQGQYQNQSQNPTGPQQQQQQGIQQFGMPQQQPGSQLPAAQGVYQPMGQPYPPLAFPHPYLPIPRPRKRRDPNRLPGDRAFFHVTDAASYLRSVAGYQWWRPLLTLFVALGWIAVCEGLSVCLLGVVSFAYLFPFLIQGGNSYHTFVSSIPADPTNWISILINFGFTALTFLPRSSSPASWSTDAPSAQSPIDTGACDGSCWPNPCCWPPPSWLWRRFPCLF